MNEINQSLLARLADALEAALRQAVEQARRTHAGERFYAYILFTSPLLTYAALSFNTEEALATIAETEREREALRWQPPEWKYHWEGEEFFRPVDEILTLLLDRQGYDELALKNRWTAFTQAIKNLDAQALFGTAAKRESVLVNIMWGDQDAVAHVESARELNPLSSYRRYARHQLPTLRAGAKEIEGSRSMYKVESLARIHRCIDRVEADLHAAD
jgi:hypothetical protein